jgi:hypothetical protein
VLILDLHSITVPQHLQIFNQRFKISVDVITRLVWPGYQARHHNIFPFVTQPRRKVQNRQHNWSCAMHAIVHEWINVICAHYDPNILGSFANSVFYESIFYHCVASVGYLIILASCFCFSLCHHNNSDFFVFAK